MALYCTKFVCIVGELRLIANENALVAVLWENEQRNLAQFAHASPSDHPILQSARQQLAAYFAGGRRQFDLPIYYEGTSFQQQIWRALQTIPYGGYVSYGELAQHIDRPTAVRAVASAVGRNPLSIILPCHRVLGKDGQIGGFAGGLEHKRTLLDLEKITYIDKNAKTK